MLLMVQGHVADLTVGHVAIASETGLLAISPALALTFTRYARHLANRWASSVFIGVCGFAADALVHASHYAGTYTEAVLTGLGTTAASLVVSYTPLGKRIERLAEPLIHRTRAEVNATS
jgi:hypothetical protein